MVSIENCGQMGGKDLSTWIFLMICFWCVCVCVCMFLFFCGLGGRFVIME